MENTGIIVRKENLPQNIEDLAKFVLIGRDRLTAVRAAIRAIDKVGVAAEVYQQKLSEGQDIAEAVLDAEMRLGELRKNVQRNEYHSGRMGADRTASIKTPLQEFDTTAQLERHAAQAVETLAAHPETVERVKAEAREKGEIVTRKAVLDEIKRETDKPHVTFNSGNNEWYTPSKYIEAARDVLGTIDLDPASSETANQTVKATCFFLPKTTALSKNGTGACG